ncbi:MAG: DNA repair protein RecN [Spirochaetaceae bacterium]|nr:MAG: DNA repair protein RecN [Spirochaetaceae bacterium]
MLEEFSIQNYALIDRLVINFTSGFNVLTGETGAGKSILAGALSLLHGARADTGAIRTGADETLVSAVFNLRGNSEALTWLAEHGVEPEDDAVIVRRTVKRAGRGSIYVQNAPVTRADLEELSGLIFDLHGQHEHQSLLVAEQHRILLDRYAGIEQRVVQLGQQFSDLSGLKKRYDRMLASERERQREMDILEFAVREIEAAALRAEEEEQLENEKRILSQHEKLFGALDQIYDRLAENRGGAVGQVRAARHEMDTVVQIDDSLSAQAKRLDDLFFELEDVVESVRDYQSTVNYSSERLEQCEERLALIHRLEKKYGATVADVLDYLQEAQQQLSSLETWEDDKAALQRQISDGERALLSAARQISAERKRAAEQLGGSIEAIINTLGMAKARFSVAVEPRESASGKPSCGASGLDLVSFRIAANQGEPLKELKDIASGGEISRVMLAIKTVLAQNDHIQSLVFDEIDAGIGGEVAIAVGTHLHQLSRYKQVLCITHLASIAVRADNHIKVEKAPRDDRTVTRIDQIDGDQRIEEIARMLAGDRTGKTSRTHAEELLAKYGGGR